MPQLQRDKDDEDDDGEDGKSHSAKLCVAIPDLACSRIFARQK
jgi:hypothetical protein